MYMSDFTAELVEYKIVLWLYNWRWLELTLDFLYMQGLQPQFSHIVLAILINNHINPYFLAFLTYFRKVKVYVKMVYVITILT